MTATDALAERYRQQTTDLAEANEAAVVAAWERNGEPERFATVAGALTAVANVAAVRLADRYTGDALTLARRSFFFFDSAYT